MWMKKKIILHWSLHKSLISKMWLTKKTKNKKKTRSIQRTQTPPRLWSRIMTKLKPGLNEYSVAGERVVRRGGTSASSVYASITKRKNSHDIVLHNIEITCLEIKDKHNSYWRSLVDQWFNKRCQDENC